MTDLTRITVNLVPKAEQALQAAVDRTGYSKTDTINRALQLYDLVTRDMAAGKALMLCDEAAGKGERITFL